MKFKIVHEIKGRIRIHMDLKRISPKDADILQYYLLEQPCVLAVKVYERNQDAAICYTGKKEEVISILQRFSFRGGGFGAGACLAEFRKGIKPKIPGKNYPESGHAHGS